jgi:hypothetical protein
VCVSISSGTNVHSSVIGFLMKDRTKTGTEAADYVFNPHSLQHKQNHSNDQAIF